MTAVVVDGGRAGVARRLGVLVLSAVAALVVGGCTGPSAAPSPPPVPASAPVAEEPAPGQGRDVAPFTSRPCDMLTPAQVAALGLVRPENLPKNVGTPDDGRGPSACVAERPVPGASPGELTDDVTVVPAAGQDVLAAGTRGVAPPDSVNPLPLQGLPAALIAQPDSYQRCILEVRTAPGQGFEVYVGRARQEVGDTCEIARAVGDAVATTLPRR